MTDPTHAADRHDADRFPILHEMDFFNHAGVAPISGPAADALANYARQAASHAYVGHEWYRQAHHVKTLAARLVNAPGAANIAFVPNTSSGLALLARGLDWRRGDNVIITDVEFPANRYMWQDLARLGVELIEIPAQPDGVIDVDDVTEAINDRTRVVSLSHVQFTSGHRIDLRPIADMVHRAGGLLCVDAIQSVGVLPVDVQAMGIDFLSADGHKWMLGPEGCGLVYCESDLIQMLHPAIIGWMNMPIRQEFTDYRFVLHTDARRFEPGSYNIPGVLAMGASLQLLLEVGIDEVWSRVSGLTDRLRQGLSAKGYAVFGSDDPSQQSGIVSFSAGDPARHQAILDQLEKQKIILALRQGRLRASPHFYNTPQQIDRLLAALP